MSLRRISIAALIICAIFAAAYRVLCAHDAFLARVTGGYYQLPMSQRILLEIRQQLGFKPPAPSFHDWMKDHPSFLVRIWAYGGLCPDGPCGGETIIDKSGRIFRSRFSNQQGSLVGSLNDKTMAELSHRIEHIDLAKIAASHHVGTCSSASDGPDEELTFNTSAGITTIDSCKNEFNAASFDLYKSFIDAIRKATKP